MAKRNPQDILDDIERSDVDDAAERVAAMTPDERRAELVAAGFTVEELNAKADALAAKMRGGRRTARRRPVAAIVAAGLAAAAAGAVLVAYVGNGQVGAPRPDAATLRREGLDACRNGSWQPCLDKLDEAREIDPDGDRTPEVQAARRSADDALHPRK